MKYRSTLFKTILFPLLLLSGMIRAQYIAEEMAERICDCIEMEVNQFDSLDHRIDSCTKTIIVSTLTDSTQTFWNKISSVEDVQYIIYMTHTTLFNICPEVRHTVLQTRRAKFYKAPETKMANYYFEMGGILFEMEDGLHGARRFRRGIAFRLRSRRRTCPVYSADSFLPGFHR